MALNFRLHLLVFIISFTTIAACPENGNCETCNLTLSVNKESVNNVIRIPPQDSITFFQKFQQQPHSGFTFEVNDVVFTPHDRNPDFPCTAEGDASRVVETLEVQYHCIPVQPGSYGIEASVHYCGKDYQAQNQFTVIVENDLPTPSPSISSSTLLSIPSSTSSTMVPPMPSTLNPSPTRSSLQSSSTTMAIAPSDSSSRMLNSTNTSVSPPVTTDNDSTVSIVIGVVTCAFTGLILTGVIIMILLKCGKQRVKNVLCCWSEQPTPDPPPPGDYPINLQTQDRYTRAVSEISTEDSGSYMAASDFPTPVESTSLSYVNPEQVVMSEAVASEQPESAITPHQLGTNYYSY